MALDGLEAAPFVLHVRMSSWKGTLQQYAGRLHRAHAGKTDVRIIDFVDAGHPALLRIWGKRQRGFRAMGWRVEAGTASYESLL